MSDGAKPEPGPEQATVNASPEAVLEARVRKHLEILGLPCLGKSLDEILAGMNMVAEGVKTAQLVGEMSEKYGVPMPICHQIQGVITGKWSAIDAYTGLVPVPGHEAEPEQVR